MTVVVTSVVVTYSRTIRVREYESMKAEISLSADLDGDDLHEAMTSIWQMARENVRAQIMRVKRPDAPPTGALGLPLPGAGEPPPSPTTIRSVEDVRRVLGDGAPEWTAVEIDQGGADLPPA